MQQIININGYETVIEIPEGQPGLNGLNGLNGFTAKVEGDENSYRIHYSENLVESGGTATLSLTSYNSEANIQEGSVRITLPTTPSNWLTTQVTVMDVGARVNEHAHIVKNSDNSFTIWGGVHGQGDATMRVYWSVKYVL